MKFDHTYLCSNISNGCKGNFGHSMDSCITRSCGLWFLSTELGDVKMCLKAWHSIVVSRPDQTWELYLQR